MSILPPGNNFDECGCDCHMPGMDISHLVPCCNVCKYCKKNIKTYCIENHEIECIKETFNNFSTNWHKETMFSSSGGHDNYNFWKIVEMGKPVLPLIFEKIEKEEQYGHLV